MILIKSTLCKRNSTPCKTRSHRRRPPLRQNPLPPPPPKPRQRLRFQKLSPGRQRPSALIPMKNLPRVSARRSLRPWKTSIATPTTPPKAWRRLSSKSPKLSNFPTSSAKTRVQSLSKCSATHKTGCWTLFARAMKTAGLKIWKWPKPSATTNWKSPKC